MAFYGFIGFVIGFIAGMAGNAYLLQDIPKERWLKDKSMRLRYGLFNWGVALLGLMIGIALFEAR